MHAMNDHAWSLTRHLLHALRAQPRGQTVADLATRARLDLPAPPGDPAPIDAWLDHLERSGAVERDGAIVRAARAPRTLSLRPYQLVPVRERLVAALPTPRAPRRGWQLAPQLDPTAGVLAVPTLRLRPDYQLVAYAYRDGRLCSAKVWAMPHDLHAPPPAGLPTLDLGPLAVPRPPGALDDALAAIETDGTPLAAAHLWLLGMAFDDLGTLGAGSGWASHELLFDAPWRWQGDGLQRPSPTEAWTWTTPPPGEWGPRLDVLGSGAMVLTVHTWSGLGTERVERHTVNLRADGQPRATRREVLGTSTGGLSL